MLGYYKKALRQEVKFHKSTIFFSKNVSAMRRRELSDLLQVVKDDNNSKYLRMLIMVARKKAVVFSFPKEKLKARLST